MYNVNNYCKWKIEKDNQNWINWKKKESKNMNN